MQIKDVSEQHAGTYTLVLRNRLAGLEKRISLQLIVNGKGGGQGWGWGESAKPMAPALGLLQDQVPTDVLKHLVPTSSPPALLRDALFTVRLVPCGLGDMTQFCSWLHHSGQDKSLLRGCFPTAVGDTAEGDPD